jgi:hypothetical protein
MENELYVVKERLFGVLSELSNLKRTERSDKIFIKVRCRFSSRLFLGLPAVVLSGLLYRVRMMRRVGSARGLVRWSWHSWT